MYYLIMSKKKYFIILFKIQFIFFNYFKNLLPTFFFYPHLMTSTTSWYRSTTNRNRTHDLLIPKDQP
jgi:hypothetical protein